MKKIFESPLNGWNESATKVHVYALESDDEYWELYKMGWNELCDYFDVMEEPVFGVAPGAIYHRYEFRLEGNHIIMYETVAYNV